MKPARRIFEQLQRTLENVEREFGVERGVTRRPEFRNSAVLLNDKAFAPAHVLCRLGQ
jgi:hypothetical protein